MIHFKFNFKILLIPALLAIIGISYSCSDEFYNEKTDNLITPDQHYKSNEDLRAAMAGAIKPLQTVVPNMIIVDGLRSDLADTTANSNNYLRDINNQNLLKGNPYLVGSNLYKVIINVNEILANIGRIQEHEYEFNKNTLFADSGALLGLRAWCYLNLIRMYGKAKLITNNRTELPANSDTIFLDRITMIDTLINQLVPYVFENLGNTEYGEIVLFGYPNMKAVLGELYLEKDDYTNAAKYLQYAIQTNTYAYDLQASYKVTDTYFEKKWKDLFINADNNKYDENIFILPFSIFGAQFNPVTELCLNYKIKPTKNIVELFNAQLPSKLEYPVGDNFRGKGITFDTLKGSSTTFINKYSIVRDREAYSSDIILSRAADLHLLLAEALNRLGDTTVAMTLLNSGFKKGGSTASYSKWYNNIGIRGRVGLANIYADPAAPDKMLAIEDLIIQERSMELAYEGKRFFDLMRIARRRNDPSYLADKVAAKFPVGSEQYNNVKSILLNKDNWYWPDK